jgi:hypothetical protein
MLKLNAGFSRKVGEPNYGSRGASVNVELELESNLVGDPDGLTARIKSLFDLARRSVDEELNNHQAQAEPSDSSQQNSRRHTSETSENNKPTGGNGNQSVRYATASQARAIRAICNRQGVDPVRLANERYRVNDLEELTLREASSLIDELKAAPRRGKNGGGR